MQRINTHSAKMKSIPLTKGQSAFVDNDDYPGLKQSKWHANISNKGSKKTFYAVRSQGRKLIFMHRQIMKCPQGLEIDHINGNTLDNRKSNLRICTRSQNSYNSNCRCRSTKNYKGVFNRNRKGPGKWTAQIGFMYRTKYIGTYKIETKAAKAYDDKAKELFGEFANLNFPKSIRRKNIYRWLMATNGRVFALIFIKRSTGEERKIYARVGVKTRQKVKSMRAGMRYNPRNKRLIVVYDMKERTYKSIPIDGIEAVFCRGRRYRVE